MWMRTAALLAIFLFSVAAHGSGPYGATAIEEASPTPATRTMDMGEKRKRCREKWREYRESQACFAPYRLVNGGVKAEAFKYCKDVKQPELCE